jgi:hypothetical protein
MTDEDDEALESLLRWAGRRPTPPSEVASAVYLHSRRAWLAQVQRRKALQRGYAWAAGVVAFIMASWGALNLYPHQIMATVPPGQAVLITHTLWHSLAGHRVGGLYEGDAVQTAAAGASLRRADGTELSLARDTRISLASASTVRLWRGRLYVQTDGMRRAHDLVVSTDLGSVEHLGTQFMVERETDALLVAVRDGRVALHYPQHQAVELQDGEAASVDPHGDLRRWELSAFDSTWDWADVLATPLVIEGQSLYAVLSRIAQRSGLVLRFSTPSAETEARGLALHGAPLALQPRDALSAVLATTTLSGTTVDRQILVSAR